MILNLLMLIKLLINKLLLLDVSLGDAQWLLGCMCVVARVLLVGC